MVSPLLIVGFLVSMGILLLVLALWPDPPPSPPRRTLPERCGVCGQRRVDHIPDGARLLCPPRRR